MTTGAFDTFGKNLDEAVRRYPERAAVRGWEVIDGPPREFTYAELDAAASELAEDLRAAGAEIFEPSVVFVSNRPEDMITLLGAWRAGLVAVPLHRECSPETLRQILGRTSARFLLMGQPPPPLELPAWKHWKQRYSTLLANEAVAPAKSAELAGAALVMFTSGSTGEPKGVILTREAFSKKLAAIHAVLQLSEGVRSLLVLQLNFAFGQWVTFLTLLLSGTVVMLPKFEPERVLAFRRGTDRPHCRSPYHATGAPTDNGN